MFYYVLQCTLIRTLAKHLESILKTKRDWVFIIKMSMWNLAYRYFKHAEVLSIHLSVHQSSAYFLLKYWYK